MFADLLLMVQNECPIVIRILCPIWGEVDRTARRFRQTLESSCYTQAIAIAALARIVVAHEQIRRAVRRLVVKIQIDAPLPHACMINRQSALPLQDVKAHTPFLVLAEALAEINRLRHIALAVKRDLRLAVALRRRLFGNHIDDAARIFLPARCRTAHAERRSCNDSDTVDEVRCHILLMRHAGHAVDIPLVAIGAESTNRDIAVRCTLADANGGTQGKCVENRPIGHAELLQGFLAESHRLKRRLHDVLRAEQADIFPALDKAAREFRSSSLHDRF